MVAKVPSKEEREKLQADLATEREDIDVPEGHTTIWFGEVCSQECARFRWLARALSRSLRI